MAHVKINIQPLPNGDAKPYQLRQFLAVIDEYDLGREGRS
jgi:hypothetical protein